MMKPCCLFLLVYLLGSCFGNTTPPRNPGTQEPHSPPSCGAHRSCHDPSRPASDPASDFLQCVGVPANNTEREHMRNLKRMLEAMMDVYTFMRSSVSGVPVLGLHGGLELDPNADPLHNEVLVKMWLEVKMKPLLRSITKNFLTCLSIESFSCSTYQTVVKELSYHFSDMDPVRQKWIYTFFMYPFLSGDKVSGCMSRNETSEDWLMKNFGAFRAMATMKDLSALNLVFSGLNVLHLLTPAQKAELLLRPEVAGIDNDTISLVFHSMLAGGGGSPPPMIGGTPPTMMPGDNFTYFPYIPPPPHHGFQQTVNGFLSAFKPVQSFVHEFVSFTHERDVSEMKSSTLTQFLLNWTLAELASMYRPPAPPPTPDMLEFDVTNVEDWYQQVVMPILRRVAPDHVSMMGEDIKMAFHHVFYLDHGYMDNETIIQDVCSITLDETPCGLTDTVQNVAHILHCAGQTNLTMSEQTLENLIMGLTERLNSLIKQLFKADFMELEEEFKEIFYQTESPAMTQQHLQDPEFIKMWFKVKLMPLLPHIPPPLLSCLSTKNFSCPVYQTIVHLLSKHMSLMHANPMYSHNIFTHFIYPFLQRHNMSDPQCVSSANNSVEWLMLNFGAFSKFASITQFYQLNPYFSGLEVLPLLTPKQLAELVVLDLPTPPEKEVVIDEVLGFVLEDPEERGFKEFAESLIWLVKEVEPPCNVYEGIFLHLYAAIPSVAPHMEPHIWRLINKLIFIAPDECVPTSITCPATQFNATYICKGVNSDDLHSYLNMHMGVSCNFTLEKYACSKPENFTAHQLASLLMCHLPGESRHSRTLWKLLLTQLSAVLDPALDILANMSMASVGASAMEVLDVIGEIRVSILTEEQLSDPSVIDTWFGHRLRPFLPFASGRFLHCLSARNLSCQSYQHILRVFSHSFEAMTMNQRYLVFKQFVLPVLTHPVSGPGCLSGFNSSAEWLQYNLGPFAAFLSLEEIVHLNPEFNPLEDLQLLSPKQLAELLVLDLPSLPDREDLIETLFDHLSESPDEDRLPEFLTYLVPALQHGNLSCSSYKTLFERLDLASAAVSPHVASSITYIKIALSQHIPTGCIIYSGECKITFTNETDICHGVNSTTFQMLLDGGMLPTRHICHFSVEEVACASLSTVSAEQLAAILSCRRPTNASGSTASWKLLFSKVTHQLGDALDLISNEMLDPEDPAVSMILDAIREILLDSFNFEDLSNQQFIHEWFGVRLLPFLPAVSRDFLSCLTTRGLTCPTYQQLIKILSSVKPRMPLPRQMSVYQHFIKVYLSRNNTVDANCRLHINNSGEWLQRNVGAFSDLASIQDLLMLNDEFSGIEALPLLTVRQLAELSSTPGQLDSEAQVVMVMRHVPDRALTAFYDDFASAIQGHDDMLPSPVRSALLQVAFDRANLTHQSVGDVVVSRWLLVRLRPLLVNLSPRHVSPFFQILAGRSCGIGQQGVDVLNMTISSLSDVTEKEIHNHIIQSLRGPMPLRCYGDNFNHSFYRFLEDSFLSFQFPNLTTFLLLMPHDQMNQLVNSMPPSDLGDFLRRPNIVDGHEELCLLYDTYTETPKFLEVEEVPVPVRRPTLPCVWPMALRTTERPEVDAWFDRRLPSYLPFLTKGLLVSGVTHNASCQAFQKLVSVLGDFNYTMADIVRRDGFDSIRNYLTLGPVAAPRCYEPNNPDLNSTAWFAQYIGPFMGFLTLEDLLMFGSPEVLQVFTVNPLNIALLNHSALPVNLTDYYTELVYQQDPNFNPLLLPLLCRCVAPGAAFSQLNANESLSVLNNLTDVCSEVDPQIAAALAGNFEGFDASTISALGSESSGISTGQLKQISAADLLASIGVLSGVTGWNQGQANAIIASLISSGVLQINSASALTMLGTLVVGVPSATFTSISANQLITASQNPSFLASLMTAPPVVQETFVTQIITGSTNNEIIVDSVPNALATEIPRPLLVSFSSSQTLIATLNQKQWTHDQAELFFSLIATETSTAHLGSVDDLSSSVLQGFTCSAVRSLKIVQIKRLIRACRRSGSRRVTLAESQLTCMYSYIKDDANVTMFDLYPPDMLLYYDYALVPAADCRSYFQQLANADFSLVSSALSYRVPALFTNARSCLGISNTNLTEEDVSVLGNMCCTLSGAYIQDSHPSILGVLNNCPQLSSAQASAVETLLESGRTQYGAPETWNEETLRSLGMLPLYMPSTFYDNFDRKTKRRFMRYFLRVLRGSGVGRRRRRSFKRAVRASIRNKSRRSVDNVCTVGEITQVTISDETFPFDYDDVAQFNCCLSAATVRENLDAITDKVDLEEYLSIVLSKLREGYTSSVPEDQVLLLGPASRLATTDDIQSWDIRSLDTLSSLMDATNGEWEPTLAKDIVTKYLDQEGNSLGRAELNAIGGQNLCFLDLDRIQTISATNLRAADALNVSSCSQDKKNQLFTVAQEAFTERTRTTTVSLSTYQLIEPYLGGTTTTYAKTLVASNINMPLSTFVTMPENVIMDLSVNDVRNLLGTNLAELRSYENQTVVNNWIRSQLQSDLDTLGLMLSGGRASPSSTAAATTAAGAATTPAATTKQTAAQQTTTTGGSGSGSGSGSSTSSTTTGGVSCIRADVGLPFLTLLALLIASQHFV